MSQKSFAEWQSSRKQALPQQQESEQSTAHLHDVKIYNEESAYDRVVYVTTKDGKRWRIKSLREQDWERKAAALEQFKTKIHQMEATYQDALQTPNQTEEQRNILAEAAAKLEADKQTIAQAEAELEAERKLL